MATIFRREGSRNWYISYFTGKMRLGKDGRLRPERVTESLGTSDETLAKQEKRRRELELETGSHRRAEKSRMREVLELYKKNKADRGQRTNKEEFYVLDRFAGACGNRLLSEVKEEDILAFLGTYQSKSRVTFNNVLGAIRRFFRFAIKRRKLNQVDDPTLPIDRKRTVAKRVTFFTDEEYSRIERAAAEHPLFPMIATARYAGLRLGELRHLEWEDFAWDKREIAVRNKPNYGHTVKTYQERVVPLPEELTYKLLPFKKTAGFCFPIPYGRDAGKIYGPQGPRRPLKKILKTASVHVEGEGWHKLRRTYGSRLVQEGVDIYKVSRWMGHSSVKVTEKHCAELAPKYDRDIEKLSLNHPDAGGLLENLRS